MVEDILLLVNAIRWRLFFVGFGLLLKKKWEGGGMIVIEFLMCFLLYGKIV